MRKEVVSVVVLTTALLLGSAVPGFAGERSGGPQGGHGAGQARGSSHTGFGGNPGRAAHPAWRGGFGGNPGGAPHPAWRGGFRGYRDGRTGVFIGSGFWWGDPWWWGPAYPYYVTPPVVLPEAPPVYTQQEPPAQQPYYWYYCPNPAGYYPYVKECPSGWMTVVPPANPPAP